MTPKLTITRINGVWHWKVDADDAVYSGVCDTRWEAEAEGGRVAWDARSTVPWVDPTSSLRADLAIAIARAEKAEATAARLNAANVRLMRRLAPTLGALVASADKLAKMGQRAVAAEAALATARAEVDAAFQQGLTAGQVATCGALSAIAAEVASAGFDETATAIRIAAATLIKADLRLERSPVEGA